MSNTWKEVTLGEVKKYLGDNFYVVTIIPRKPKAKYQVICLEQDYTETYETLSKALEEIGERVISCESGEKEKIDGVL